MGPSILVSSSLLPSGDEEWYELSVLVLVLEALDDVSPLSVSFS
jgi:hypothetical protein